MPRDDLSIDFVKRTMPQAEALDPAIILEDWTNRVQNLPEEIRFLQEEIEHKDREYSECVRAIEEKDGKIQKWIKMHGSHTANPREDLLRTQIREQYVRAEQLSAEKVELTQKLRNDLDKHMRNLDSHLKLLYDRGEPGFTDPDEVPSLLRQSASNHSTPSSARPMNPVANFPGAGPVPAPPLNPILSPANTALNRIPNLQVRNAQAQQQHASSAPATPAASIILNRQARESSAGPAPKRGPRINSGLGSVPATSSGLARHSSLGPGTPKGATAAAGSGVAVRAGSAGPRAGSTKGVITGAVRKSATPSSVAGRKKALAVSNGNAKSSLSRVKKASSKNSPASTADSELSEADSGTGGEEEEDGDAAPANRRQGGGGSSHSPSGVAGKDADPDEEAGEGDDDEAGDDKKYCLCQNVSFGDMVACDNDSCPYEWFHWSCVGLKSEPNGTWYCPVCTDKMEKMKKQK
jgi:inhibitor of growth protein 3